MYYVKNAALILIIMIDLRYMKWQIMLKRAIQKKRPHKIVKIDRPSLIVLSYFGNTINFLNIRSFLHQKVRTYCYLLK